MAVLAGTVCLIACSSGGSSSSGPASCAPGGSILTETVKNVAYQATCLHAPAGAFRINLDNQDPGVPHNIEVFDKDPTTDAEAKSLFKGDLVTGPALRTYDVPALPAGRYFFHCDVHPDQMQGTLIVGG
jgi:plastocyanin